jgi:hypothetical protein
MPLTAEELRDELRPDVDAEKSLTLKIIPGQRPEVTFTGTWTGKYIKAAMDSIAKCYRITRRTVLKNTAKGQTPTLKEGTIKTQVTPEGGK